MSKCTVDDAALKRCQEGYADFIAAIKRQQDETARRDKLLAAWTVADADWVRKHDEQLRLRDVGRKAGQNEVWHNNRKYDCKTQKYV
jgi:hypothetical protein